eukprot:g5474.t1
MQDVLSCIRILNQRAGSLLKIMYTRGTLVQSPGGLSSFLCEICPEEISIHTVNSRVELAVSWIEDNGVSGVFSEDVHVSIEGEFEEVAEIANDSVNTVFLNVILRQDNRPIPLTVRVGNWSRSVDIIQDIIPPTASIELVSEDDVDDVHEYTMIVRFSESVMQRTLQQSCPEVNLINSSNSLSAVLRQSNRCTEVLMRSRASNSVLANNALFVSSVITRDNTAFYVIVRTPDRINAHDINVTLSSEIEDFSGNALVDVPHFMLFYRPVIGMPSRERLDRFRKRQIRLTSVSSYSGARTVGRLASVAVAGSCASMLASSASSGSAGGSTTLINNVQKLHMTGLLAVTNMPDGYKNFTNEVGWAVLDIDTPWRDNKVSIHPCRITFLFIILFLQKNRTSSANTLTNQRSLKQLDASLEAGDEEDELDYFERIMFWVPLIFIAIVILHLLLLVIFFLKEWELPDILQPPRIELMLAFFLLPPIAIAAAGLYQGSRNEAILATWLIIAVPVNFICWNLFMLWYFILRLPPHLREANQITDIPSQKQRAIKKLRAVATLKRGLGAIASSNRRRKLTSVIKSRSTQLLSQNNSTAPDPAPDPALAPDSEPDTSAQDRHNTPMYQYSDQEVNSQGEEEIEPEKEAFSCGEIYEILSNMNLLTLLFGEHQNEADWTSTRQQGSKFVARFGPLFEDHRGPAIGRRDATLDIDPVTGKVDRGTLVVIRERPLFTIPAIGRQGYLFYIPKTKIHRFHLQILAKLLDISKTILVGCIVAGVGNSEDNVGSVIALIALSLTLLFLFRLAKPFPSRMDMLLLILTEFADLIVYTCALFLLLGPDVDQDTQDNIAFALILSEGFSLIAMVIEYTLISIGIGLLAWEAYDEKKKTKFFDFAYRLMKEDGRYLQRKYCDLWMVRVLKRGLNGREPQRHELPWRYMLHLYAEQNWKNALWLYDEMKEIVIDAKQKLRIPISQPPSLDS